MSRNDAFHSLAPQKLRRGEGRLKAGVRGLVWPILLDFAQYRHKNRIILKLFPENVWWNGKNVVPLHSLFRDTSDERMGRTFKRSKKEFFERFK